jgi:hypothetical protein
LPHPHRHPSIALATKISAKADDTLAKLDHEMTIMKWPDEFRAIMWEAVAAQAAIYAKQSREASCAVSSKDSQ